LLIGPGEYDPTTASPGKQQWVLGLAAVVIAVGVGVAV
jgi:hypothetical protein